MCTAISFPDGAEKIPAFNTLRCEQNLKEPETNAVSTRYTQHVITESEGYTQSVKADADLQASGWGAKMKASFSTSSTQSGSSSSVLLKTNAWVEYDRATKVQGDSGKCQPFLESVERELKDKAKIPGGLQEWHDKHGTHFISGYYAFASATAKVQITEYDSKKREEIHAALSAAYTGYGTTVGGSASFSALVGTEAAGRRVTNYIATNGVTSGPPNDSIEALGDYIFHLSNFTDPKANRHKVILSPYSDCKSYQEALMLVPDGGDFPQVPTVTDDIFTLWVEVHFLQDGLTKLQEYCSGLRATSVPLNSFDCNAKIARPDGWIDSLSPAQQDEITAVAVTAPFYLTGENIEHDILNDLYDPVLEIYDALPDLPENARTVFIDLGKKVRIANQKVRAFQDSFGIQPPPPPPPPACTPAGFDPYLTDTHVDCCPGTTETLGPRDWDQTGVWHYKCV